MRPSSLRSLLSLLLLLGALVLALPHPPPPSRGKLPTGLGERAASSLNQLLALIAALFPVNVAIGTVDDLIGAASATLAAVLHISTSEDGLGPGSACAGLSIVFARGTSEPGNVGVIVGPSFFDAVRRRLEGSPGTLTVQGVEYPATVSGFLLGGDVDGSKEMADIITQTLESCPKTKLVMSGYSQGAQLVHNAAKQLPASTMAKVSSVVVFGDPDYGTAVPGILTGSSLVLCNKGDNICQQGDVILLPHLTYAEQAEQAAKFVVERAGVPGK